MYKTYFFIKSTENFCCEIRFFPHNIDNSIMVFYNLSSLSHPRHLSAKNVRPITNFGPRITREHNVISYLTFAYPRMSLLYLNKEQFAYTHHTVK